MVRYFFAVGLGLLLGLCGAAIYSNGLVRKADLASSSEQQSPIHSATVIPIGIGPDSEGDSVNVTSIKQLLDIPSEFKQTLVLYQLANGASLERLEQLIQESLTLPKLEDQRGALFILFSKLADLDPVRALEVASAPEFRFDHAFEYAIWQSWIKSDFSTALEVASTLPSNQQRERAANDIYFSLGINNPPLTDRVLEVLGIKPTRWALYNYAKQLSISSPEEAIVFLNNSIGSETQVYLGGMLGTLHANMFEKRALAFASSIISNLARERYLSTAKKRLVELNPEKAMLESLNDSNGIKINWLSVKTALTQLASTDFDSAEQFWLNITDKQQQLKLGRVLVGKIARRDFSKAIVWAQQMEDSGVEGIKFRAVEELASIDPLRTLEAMDLYHFGQHHDEVKAVVITALAITDTELAIQKFRELPNSPKKNRVIEKIIEKLAPHDSGTALDLLIEHQNVLMPDKLFSIAYQLKNIEPEKAQTALQKLSSSSNQYLVSSLFTIAAKGKSEGELNNLVNQLESSPAYQEVLMHATNKRLEDDPQAALDYAYRMSSGKQKDSAITNVIYKLSLDNPLAASALIAQVSGTEVRQAAISSLVFNWSESDPSEAHRWVAEIPDGVEKDVALLALTQTRSQVTNGDTELIDQIQQSRLKRSAISSRLRQLARQDSESAFKFINEVNVSDSWRNVYLEILNDCYTGEPVQDENLLHRGSNECSF